MTLPRLGNAIIINNVFKSVPGSEANVKRLKEAYETVGFDVFIYRDPTTEVKIYLEYVTLKFEDVTNTIAIVKMVPIANIETPCSYPIVYIVCNIFTILRQSSLLFFGNAGGSICHHFFKVYVYRSGTVTLKSFVQKIFL